MICQQDSRAAAMNPYRAATTLTRIPAKQREESFTTGSFLAGQLRDSRCGQPAFTGTGDRPIAVIIDPPSRRFLSSDGKEK